MRCGGLERQIAQLVDDQQPRLAEVGQAVLEPAFAMRLGKLATNLGAGMNCTVSPARIAWRPIATAPDCYHPDCCRPDCYRKVRLADTGRR